MSRFALAVCTFALLFVVGAAPAFAQEANDLEKILNPLPDYNPFENPPPVPEFFPDEVDRAAREAAIASLTRRPADLKKQLELIARKDVELKRERGRVSGLSELMRELYNGTIDDRESRLRAQREALRAASSAEQQKLIAADLAHDARSRAEELAKKGQANRLGGALNTLLSSVDLLGILSGSYAGAAIDSALQYLLLKSPKISPEERRALALYREHLKRYPADPQNAEVWRRVEALEKKQKAELVSAQLDQASEALGKADLERAAFHYELALLIDPGSAAAREALERLEQRKQAHEQARSRAFSVESPADPAASETQAEPLLYALALRDPEQIEGEAGRLASDPALASGALDSRAVALEIRGQHEEATRLLRQLARSAASPAERGRAQALLRSPEYNLLEAFQRARAERRLETVKFVLLGEDFLKRNLLIGAAPLVTYGPAGAVTLGAANVLLVGTNLFSVLTANPVSSQEVLERGLAYVRAHPEQPSASEVYRVLAQAYEEKGRYDKAIAYYQMAGGVSEAKLKDLEEKAARGFLLAAQKSPDPEARRIYLETILEYYPDSEAAGEATRGLAQLAKPENRGLQLTKQFLMKHPELYGPEGLRLKPALFDGSITNMELAGRGVNVVSDREVVLHFQTPWGVHSQAYRVERAVIDNFMAALRRKNYDLALQDVETRPKGSPGGLGRLPASLFRGEWARKPTPEEEADFVFLRQASGPDQGYSRVLDHQLVAESEREPGFKLPPIRGSVSARGVDVSGSLPAGLWGDKLAIGTDPRSPYAQLQLPIPLLKGFVPVDFMLQGRPGRIGLFPRIHTSSDATDSELYR